MRFRIDFKYFVLLTVLVLSGCQGLDTINENNPDRSDVLTSGDDLAAVLRGGYVAWWQGVHGDEPVLALSVAADAYGLSRGDFGAERLGWEPRPAYNNRTSEETRYRNIVEAPWYGCLSAVSSANDVLAALNEGVTIDNGGAQDQAIRTAAHLLRGLSWGYLGLLFDQALLVDADTDLGGELSFTPYREVIEVAVGELEEAISLAEAVGFDFNHPYFHGVLLNAEQLSQLAHAYAARFLAQWPRTAAENALVDWAAVADHAEKGLTFDFAPVADGNLWRSYQVYAFAATGQGPFWARVDQRLVAALDPGQPARYPEVEALGEEPLPATEANSPDRRLQTDFLYLPTNNFPVSEGEWHFSHYQHHRNVSQPGFAGDGLTFGPMPVFLQADNDLLRAEALLRLDRGAEAVGLLNAGARVTRGELPPLSMAAPDSTIDRVIRYERAIELLGTAPMGLWLDRRRWDERQDYREVDALGGLQTGTPAQLPVPAAELRIHGEEPYNFGGAADPEGVMRTY